jgi:cob(I)alamin adenosyltransferase
VSKANQRIDAYGTIDELNAFVACLLETISDREDLESLLKIQSNLFTLGGYLASEPGTATCWISEEDTAMIETAIDRIDAVVPQLNRFILPGGCSGSVWANLCRAVCRRAERCMIKINRKGCIDAKALKYINRLSDFFFLLSRKQNFIGNVEEIIWENPCK